MLKTVPQISFNIILFVATIFTTKNATAQISFENLPFSTNLYWKGDSGIAATNTFSDSFNYCKVIFTNRNDTSSFGDYWSGYAYSKLQDTQTVNYSNDCAAITGEGALNSDVYVVGYDNAYSPEYNIIRLTKSAPAILVHSMAVTNSTIAYRAMKDGTVAGAKKFGGITGNDPDYFRIVFNAWANGNLLPDTITFYLADYRDSNNANDYVLKHWSTVNFAPKFILADSITYHLESSDSNQFGILTPSYFCLDNFVTLAVGVDNKDYFKEVTCYPNPCNDFLMLSNKSNRKIRVNVMNLNGAIVGEADLNAESALKMNTTHLSKGIYFIQLSDGRNTKSIKLQK